MSITIPAEYSPSFRKFFVKFDKNLDKLNIRSYGVQITTLEQVFLKIGHLTDPGEILKSAVAEMQVPEEKKLKR